MKAVFVLFLAIVAIGEARTRLPDPVRSGQHYGQSEGLAWGIEGKRFPTLVALEIEAIKFADVVECPPEMRDRFVKGFIAGFTIGWPKGIMEARAEGHEELACETPGLPREIVVVSESAAR